MRSTLSLSAWLIAGFMAMHGSSAVAADAAKVTAPFNPPSEESMPAGPMGEAIRYGHQLTTQTQVYAKKYVGNGLNCTSCHLNAGRTPNAAPWVGIWGVFPEYRTRNAEVNTLQDRAALVAALASVDAVTWFEEDTPEALIAACRPEVLAKGGDWPVERIAGAQGVLARGGRVVSIPFEHERSTTALVRRIRSARD